MPYGEAARPRTPAAEQPRGPAQGRRPAAATATSALGLQRTVGNRATAGLLSPPTVQRAGTAHLPQITLATAAQHDVVKAAAAVAQVGIMRVLARPQLIRRVFGLAQVAEATAVYEEMLGVLDLWSRDRTKVKVSGWLARFGRDAETHAASQTITLPDTVEHDDAAELAMTLAHESAHGARAAVIDLAYGGTAFRVMTGPQRVFNAPHFDFAIRFLDGTRSALQIGNPDAGAGAAAGGGGAPVPAVASQLARAVSIITHARIHSENLLQHLVAVDRTGAAPSPGILAQADGIPMPAHATGRTAVGYALWGNPHLVDADITALDAYARGTAQLHLAAQALTHVVAVNPAAPAACAVVGGVLQISTPNGQFDAVPVTGAAITDPWLVLMLSAVLTAFPPGGGIDLVSLGKVDRQYHLVRGGTAHG